MKKSIIVIIAIVGIGLVIWGVNKKPVVEQTTQKELIKIGTILSETGIASAFGEMSHKGIALAAK